MRTESSRFYPIEKTAIDVVTFPYQSGKIPQHGEAYESYAGLSRFFTFMNLDHCFFDLASNGLATSNIITTPPTIAKWTMRPDGSVTTPTIAVTTAAIRVTFAIHGIL